MLNLFLFISFRLPIIFSESEETTSRPFGQPLCLVSENGDPPPSILKSSGSVRKKKWFPSLSPGMVQTYRVVGDSPWLVLTAASRTTFFQTPKRPAYCDMYIVTCYNKNQNWAAYFYSGYPQDFFYVSGAWLGGVLTNACVLSAKHIVNTKPLYLNYFFICTLGLIQVIIKFFWR